MGWPSDWSISGSKLVEPFIAANPKFAVIGLVQDEYPIRGQAGLRGIRACDLR